MSKVVNCYFKHDADASGDLKLKVIRKRHGWKGIGWYWYLIEKLRSEATYRLDYSDFIFESLAIDMDCEAKEAKGYIDDCIYVKLFKKDKDGFYSIRLCNDMDYLDKIRAKRVKAGKLSAEMRQHSGIKYTESVKR